jgi:hypothetical protein
VPSKDVNASSVRRFREDLVADRRFAQLSTTCTSATPGTPGCPSEPPAFVPGAPGTPPGPGVHEFTLRETVADE